MADSFVVRANKLGDGNGEKKLYIGNEDPALRDFYGPRGFNNKCFLMRQDLIKFLHGLKVEYTSPQLPYKKKDELPSLYTTRLAKIQALPEIIWFSIQEQTQLEPPRVYVNSKDENYKIIREL